MAGASYDREKYKVAIPQLDAKLKQLLDENVSISKQTINIVQTVEELDTDYMAFKSLATGYFTAIAGDVDYLTSRQAYIAKLSADLAEFGFLTATSAEIQSLKVGNLEIGGVQVNIYDFASTANTNALTAKSIAENTDQYFWVTETGTDVGAHITEVTKEEFLDDPTGGNLLARSNGIAVRNGLVEVSYFGADSARVGNFNSLHVGIDADSIDFNDGGTTLGYVGTDTAMFPSVHATERLSMMSKYVFRLTPDGALGLYLK